MLPGPGNDRLFIGDGGLETTLIFRDDFDLPCFASFPLLESDEGIAALRRYYGEYLQIAQRHRLGFTMDTPTWRANRDWGEKLGYSPAGLDDINRRAVALAEEIRAAERRPNSPVVICGTVGPRGDAYVAVDEMDADAAQHYHSEQIATFAATAVEMVAAYTLTYTAEAIGIVRAADACAVPVAISFTVETDGRLPSGEALPEAIEAVDAATDSSAIYFMVNCAHPTHFEAAIEAGGDWLQRLGGIRANASRKSHTELDEATELDPGDPEELGLLYAALKPHLPAASVLGGCCGTDSRHIARICERWLAATA
jgi:homocysteine S-methyltransferase